jgi:hypothetical protein
MQTTESTAVYAHDADGLGEAAQSAVSWAAIIAGAVIGAALTAMLVIGGTGLGFLAVSPWSDEGVSGTALAVGSIVWLFATQIIAYGVAGYVAGRLRTKWSDVEGDEIYFRDTAHGFLVWALSAVVGLVLLGSTAASIVSGTAKAGAALAGAGAGTVAAAAGGAATGEAGGSPMDYFTDSLLRPADPSLEGGQARDIRPEVSRILVRSIAQEQISEDDQSYLTKIISNRAGISEAEAQQRLSEVSERAKQAAQDVEIRARQTAEEARKAAATFSLWAFASLLLGAFVASFAATIGGRARDL